MTSLPKLSRSSLSFAALLLALGGAGFAAAQQGPGGGNMEHMQQMRGQMMQHMQACMTKMHEGNMPMGEGGQMMNREEMRGHMMTQMSQCMQMMDAPAPTGEGEPAESEDHSAHQ